MSRRRDERGVVAGLEGLVFGVLVLMAGTVLVVDAWSVLDTRSSLDGAAREYLRAYTEAADPRTAADEGDRAARGALDGRGTVPAVRITAPDPGRFGPCARAEVELAATVPAVRLPFVGDFGTTEIRVRHAELVDAHREVSTGADYDPTDTPCGD